MTASVLKFGFSISLTTRFAVDFVCMLRNQRFKDVYPFISIALVVNYNCTNITGRRFGINPKKENLFAPSKVGQVVVLTRK